MRTPEFEPQGFAGTQNPIESEKIFMLMYHEKNALCDSYIVEFIHDATENYYEGGIHACKTGNNIKFPLYVLKVL